jgi:succinylarginine dihydrolase
VTAELALLRRHLAVCGAGADVSAMLSAAYQALEYLAAALQAGPVFAASVVAAASAADGRGKLALAPSLLPACTALRGLYTPARVEPAALGELAALCHNLAAHLSRTARRAPDGRDRAACQDASACARRAGMLLTGPLP